jgi:hypothetical protein
VLLLGGAYVVVGAMPKKVAAPTTYEKFTAGDKSFHCEYPTGWRGGSSESQAVVSTLHAGKGAAEMTVTADLVGSLIGDMPPGGIAGMPDISKVPGAGSVPELGGMKGDTRPPVERVHDARKKVFESELAAQGIKDFDEKPPEKFTSTMGDARWAEFTGKGGMFGTSFHGIRATIMGPERAIYAECWCPEDDWARLKPAFQRVIGSIGPGGP